MWIHLLYIAGEAIRFPPLPDSSNIMSYTYKTMTKACYEILKSLFDQRVGKMNHMPRIVRPDSAWSESLEAATQSFGTPTRNMVIRFLRSNPASYRSDIVAGTGLKEPTLQNQLEVLERIGVVLADVPTGKRRGRSVRYSLDHDRVDVLWALLFQYINGAELVSSDLADQ